MATKIYLPSSGSAAVTPSSWIFTNQINPLTFAGVITPINSARITKLEPTGTTNPTTRAMLRYVIGPLAAQSISGTVRMIMEAMESTAAANANLAMAIKIIQPGGADRATLLAVTSSDAASAPYEITTTLSTKIVYTSAEVEPLTLTTQNASNGDYLVIEIGFRSATGTSRNISLRYGDDAGSDFAYTVGLTTDLNPWVEFSANLLWYEPNKYLWGGTGTFVEDGKNSILLKSNMIFSEAGGYSLTGSNAILTYGSITNRFLFGETGIFTETGYNSLLYQGRKIYGATGSYGISGDSKLFFNHQLRTSAGLFGFTGNNAYLIYPDKYEELMTDEGLFSFVGSNAILTKGTALNYYLYGNTGTFTFSGNNSIQSKTWRILGAIGSYGIAGSNSLVFVGRQLRGGTGVFNFTGYNAILTYAIIPLAYNLLTETGIFTESGYNSYLNRGLLTLGDNGVFAFSGKDVILTYLSGVDYYLYGNTGLFSIIGSALLIVSGLTIAGAGERITASQRINITASIRDKGYASIRYSIKKED